MMSKFKFFTSLYCDLLQDESVFKKPAAVTDIEDVGASPRVGPKGVATSNKRKRTSDEHSQSQGESQDEGSQNWREALGPPPNVGTTAVSGWKARNNMRKAIHG